MLQATILVRVVDLLEMLPQLRVEISSMEENNNSAREDKIKEEQLKRRIAP